MTKAVVCLLVCLGLIGRVVGQVVSITSSKSLSGNDIPQDARPRAQFPSSVQQKISLSNGNYLHVQVELPESANAPRQLFLRLQHQTLPNTEGIFTLSKAKRSSGYALSLGVDSQQFKDFVSQPGAYSAELLVGGGNVAKPFRWKFADVKLDIVAPPQEKSRYVPKEVIQHIFREPDKRASEVMSSLFAGLCVSPFALFLFLWLRVGLKFQLPQNSSKSFYLMLLLGSTAAVLVLLCTYWVGMSIFTALQGVAILGAAGTFFGLRAFSHEHESNKPDKKKRQ